MPDLNESLAKQRALAEAPTLGNLHPDARAQAIARASIQDLTAAEVRAQLQRMADAAGSQKSLARTLNVSEQYLSDVLLGRREIGPAITEALGLDAVVTFRPRGVPVDKDRCPSCGIRYGYHLASCTALADGEPERKRPASGAALPLPPAGPTGSGGWCEMCGVTHEGPHPAGVRACDGGQQG